MITTQKNNHERIKVSGIGADGQKNNVGMWIPWDDDSADKRGTLLWSPTLIGKKTPKNTQKHNYKTTHNTTLSEGTPGMGAWSGAVGAVEGDAGGRVWGPGSPGQERKMIREGPS